MNIKKNRTGHVRLIGFWHYAQVLCLSVSENIVLTFSTSEKKCLAVLAVKKKLSKVYPRKLVKPGAWGARAVI